MAALCRLLDYEGVAEPQDPRRRCQEYDVYPRGGGEEVGEPSTSKHAPVRIRGGRQEEGEDVGISCVEESPLLGQQSEEPPMKATTAPVHTVKVTGLV